MKLYKLFLVTLLPLSTATQADMCSDLKNLTEQAKADFRQLLGAYDSYYEVYAARFHLPGATDCYIRNDEGEYSYICEWETRDKMTSESNYRGMVDTTRMCINPIIYREQAYSYPERIRRAAIIHASDSVIFSTIEDVTISLF